METEMTACPLDDGECDCTAVGIARCESRQEYIDAYEQQEEFPEDPRAMTDIDNGDRD
jgi:hypothetical protein